MRGEADNLGLLCTSIWNRTWYSLIMFLTTPHAPLKWSSKFQRWVQWSFKELPPHAQPAVRSLLEWWLIFTGGLENLLKIAPVIFQVVCHNWWLTMRVHQFSFIRLVGGRYWRWSFPVFVWVSTSFEQNIKKMINKIIFIFENMSVSVAQLVKRPPG